MVRLDPDIKKQRQADRGCFNLKPFLEPLSDIVFTSLQRVRPGHPGRRGAEELMFLKGDKDRQAWLAKKAKKFTKRGKV